MWYEAARMPESTARDTDDSEATAAEASLIAALSVYLEPIASDARVLVVGDVDAELSTLLEEMGARSVHRFEAGLEVRDGAFDVAVVPDLNALDDVAGTLSRLRRVVDARGAVIAMGRARTESFAREAKDDAFPELAPALLGYAELYDQFALRFEHVAMTGVVPFRGVVFAELGHEESDVGVSVDTRLVDAPPPDVFVVVASREPVPLEPYAIVQVGSETAPRRDLEAEAAFAAMHLKAELLTAQLDEQRARVTAVEARSSDDAPRVARIVAERDAAVTRASELDAIVRASQQAMALLEKKLLQAEQGILERDDRIAVLHAELDARSATPRVDPQELAHVVARAERAEAALALHVADLAQVADAHALETAGLEAQLRERAQVIAALEKEIFRRELLVRELVASIEEAGERGTNGYVFEEAAPLSIPPQAAAPAPAPPPAPDHAALSELRDENAKLRKKLDELAMEVARREGELRAQGWKISELENVGGRVGAPANGPKVLELERDLEKSREELDALRQALRQEHALVEQLKAGASGELGRGG